MTSRRMDRLSALMAYARLDHVLLTSLASLRYFAGYISSIETGPSPFSPLMGASLWSAGEQPQLYLADVESEFVRGLAVTTFESYIIEKPLAAAKDLTAKLLDLPAKASRRANLSRNRRFAG